MPNAKVLSEKQAIVAELTEKIQKASAGVLVDYKGITVEEDTALRRECRENGVDYAVVKNTLLRFAFNNTGLNELDDLLNGTTSLALCEEDVVAPARVMSDYAKKLNDKFEIKGGFMDGKPVSLETIQSLASIPALPVLRAQFLGTMLAPITGLAVVLKQIAEKGGEPVAVAANRYEALKTLTRARFYAVQNLAREKQRFANLLFLKCSGLAQSADIKNTSSTVLSLMEEYETVDDLANADLRLPLPSMPALCGHSISLAISKPRTPA